jgi:hypothetical protein
LEVFLGTAGFRVPAVMSKTDFQPPPQPQTLPHTQSFSLWFTFGMYEHHCDGSLELYKGALKYYYHLRKWL